MYPNVRSQGILTDLCQSPIRKAYKLFITRKIFVSFKNKSAYGNLTILPISFPEHRT